MTPLILDLDTRCRWVVSFTPPPAALSQQKEFPVRNQ